MSDDRGPQIAGVVIALYVASVITGGLRFYTHAVITKRFYIEDYLTMVALLLYTVYTVFGIMAVGYGLGKHTDMVEPEHRPTAIMFRWLASIIYIFISVLTKWIVGLFLLHICPGKRWRQITIWVIMVSVSVFTGIYIVLDIISCQPIRFEWTRHAENPEPGTCHAPKFATISTYLAAGLNIIADWILPILPATLVWKAQLDRRVKISVIVLLCLGSIASIATIVRIPYAKGYLNNPDYLYTSTDICIWSTVEIGIALTAASLATLKPLLRKMNLFNMSEVASYGANSQRHTTDGGNFSKNRVSHISNKGLRQSPVGAQEPWTPNTIKESVELEYVATGDSASNKSTEKHPWTHV